MERDGERRVALEQNVVAVHVGLDTRDVLQRSAAAQAPIDVGPVGRAARRLEETWTHDQDAEVRDPVPVLLVAYSVTIRLKYFF